MMFFPLDVNICSGKLKVPSTKMLTMSILFSMFDYFTIFSIFQLEIRLTIFSLEALDLSSCTCISSVVSFCFLRVDLRILVLRSTISKCLFKILWTRGILSSLLLSFVDHILCLANISKLCFICSGIIYSISFY